MYIGDDVTDEDAFAVMSDLGGIGIIVSDTALRLLLLLLCWLLLPARWRLTAQRVPARPCAAGRGLLLWPSKLAHPLTFLIWQLTRAQGSHRRELRAALAR